MRRRCPLLNPLALGHAVGKLCPSWKTVARGSEHSHTQVGFSYDLSVGNGRAVRNTAEDLSFGAALTKTFMISFNPIISSRQYFFVWINVGDALTFVINEWNKIHKHFIFYTDFDTVRARMFANFVFCRVKGRISLMKWHRSHTAVTLNPSAVCLLSMSSSWCLEILICCAAFPTRSL